mgnify:CR=1 FL=1
MGVVLTESGADQEFELNAMIVHAINKAFILFFRLFILFDYGFFNWNNWEYSHKKCHD